MTQFEYTLYTQRLGYAILFCKCIFSKWYKVSNTAGYQDQNSFTVCQNSIQGQSDLVYPVYQDLYARQLVVKSFKFV